MMGNSHSKRVDYPEIAQTIASLAKGEDDVIALMATFACELHHADDRFDWTGFYRVVGPELMKIGPYQGSHGCLVIPFDRGVCGAAASSRKTQLVDNVEEFPGHIACSSTTRSEIVLPVFGKDDRLLGVLDIDSNQPAAFTTDDKIALETLLKLVFSRLE